MIQYWEKFPLCSFKRLMLLKWYPSLSKLKLLTFLLHFIMWIFKHVSYIGDKFLHFSFSYYSYTHFNIQPAFVFFHRYCNPLYTGGLVYLNFLLMLGELGHLWWCSRLPPVSALRGHSGGLRIWLSGVPGIKPGSQGKHPTTCTITPALVWYIYVYLGIHNITYSWLFCFLSM